MPEKMDGLTRPEWVAIVEDGLRLKAEREEAPYGTL